MGITRRVFLKSGALAVVGTATVPSFLTRAVFASERLWKRADPKNTTVSCICSRRNLASGSTYSDMMRRIRPSGLFRNKGFSYARGALFS